MACEWHGYSNPTFCPACDLDTLAAAKSALERMKARRREDVGQWAKRLAADLVSAGEAETE